MTFNLKAYGYYIVKLSKYEIDLILKL